MKINAVFFKKKVVLYIRLKNIGSVFALNMDQIYFA